MTKPIDGEEKIFAQAYIVIGNIAGNLNLDTDGIQRALDYFSDCEYDPGFLPWDLNETE